MSTGTNCALLPPSPVALPCCPAPWPCPVALPCCPAPWPCPVALPCCPAPWRWMCNVRHVAGYSLRDFPPGFPNPLQ
ncbi:unnamed protein product [Lampetra planeri]